MLEAAVLHEMMPSSKLEVWRALSDAKALKSLDDPALLQKDMWKHLAAPLGDGQQGLRTAQVRRKAETVAAFAACWKKIQGPPFCK